MKFEVGSLVQARGREWVVLPESANDVLILRPLGGSEHEVTGVHTNLEEVRSAQFELPDPSQIGDYLSCRLLRDAVRLGFRSSAGPFRCFGRLSVNPRPYQLVPLLMALKLDPVRILIADDVGIGKTIEACLVAKELLDRGEANRLAVLCPPHLAEQWQLELLDKFHINTELVLSSTAGRLEQRCLPGQSLFEVYPHVVVSTEFIKSDKRRDDFLRACPELVIVDEVHTCAFGAVGRGRHQRYQLIKGLVKDPKRHMIFVTATPHSGKEEAFRSLLAFLNEGFSALPTDLTGTENRRHREQLASHFIQRRRADIKSYLGTETEFPEREEAEETYKLSAEYRKLFDRVLNYARETVVDESGQRHRQRVRWWSALALLRSLASSPAAAAATLRSRAAVADTETPEEADQIGRQTVLDLEDDEIAEKMDITPGCDVDDLSDDTGNRRKLLDMARAADKLEGEKDNKLLKATDLIKSMVQDGYSVIVFCRFIPTAEYVAKYLREKLRGVEVEAVTGLLPPADRETRIEELEKAQKKVLVCTDCLSEGINLQDHFDAVFHYDLSWNPTRHEQREGRVDRFGQDKPIVRVLTYYGTDNQIDGIVLDVLIRKHKTIRSSLGISVPVPVDTNQVIEAIFEGLLLREESGSAEQYLPGFEEYFKPHKEDLYAQWDNVTEKEKRSRTLFAHEAGKAYVDEVSRELDAAQKAVGSNTDVQSFTEQALSRNGASINKINKGILKIDLSETSRTLRDQLGIEGILKARFEMPVPDNVIYLSRTHPFVESLANHVLNTALDPITDSIAKRSGAIRSSKVKTRTTLLLVRYRYHIITKIANTEKPLLAEDCQLLVFEGSPKDPKWLENGQADSLLEIVPDTNIETGMASSAVQRILDDFEHLQPHIEQVAVDNGQKLLEAHRRVRTAAQMRGISYRVEPKLPADIVGIYVYLPVAGGA